MFNGSSSNRAQVTYKLEGVYPNNFGVVQAGNGTVLAYTSETLDFTVKTQESKVIRADRLTSDITPVSASPQGGVNGEHMYKEYDPFIQGAMQSDFQFYGTSGVSASIATLTLAAASITAGAAPTGNDAFTSMKKGQWFTVVPAVAATQAVKDYFAGRAFRVSTTTAPTATVLALDAATPLDTSKAGATLANATINSGYSWNGATMKSYTLEVQHLDINQYRQYAGMCVSKMDMKLSVGDIVTLNFEFMGRNFALNQVGGMGTPAPSQPFTPANATKGVFDMFEGGQSISATTYIKSADISFDNTLRGQESVGVFGLAGIGVGSQKITGKLEAYFADERLYNKFVNGTASSLSIPILDVGGNGYVYYFPRIKYTAGKLGVGGQDQDNMVSVDWMALPETDQTSPWFGKSAVIFRVGAA